MSGRGEGNIKYFEVDSLNFYFLAEYKSLPTKAFGFTNKRSCDPQKNEIARCYKVTGKEMDLINFIVPRKNIGMDSDL